ncbi:MAG: SAM-dependent methyltransferase [Anaerolineales bacterium]|nr:SAM-dependent methyltransferase [Anaerolineales bacterium]
MTTQPAQTANGPIGHVVLEQYLPEGQRILSDPLARQFSPASTRFLVALLALRPLRSLLFNIANRVAPGISGGILCRKRFIDEKLAAALDAGIQTVVILGAGLDTRPYRQMEAPGVRFFEVDLPENIASTRDRITLLFGAIPAHVTLLPVDFDRDDLDTILARAGYTPDKPAFFIWEGVTQYISEKALHKSLAFLSRAAKGSQVVFTYIRKDFIAGEHFYGLEIPYKQLRGRQQLWRFGMDPEAVASSLEAYRLRVLEHVGSQEFQTRYVAPTGRTLPVMEIERSVHAVRT